MAFCVNKPADKTPIISYFILYVALRGFLTCMAHLAPARMASIFPTVVI